MGKYRVMVGRLCAQGTHRAEIGSWLIEVAIVGHCHPQIEDIDHVPIQQCGTDVARNRLVSLARRVKSDYLVMADDDMGPPEGWFKAAIDFLISHPGPAVFGSPYVCAPPMEDVQCFEWAGAESGTPSTPWAIAHITREDATRRKGIEQVDNLGTGLVAYKMECFDAFDKHFKGKPYFAYQYNRDHTAITETEDTWCHRHLAIAGVPLFVHWDLWSAHYKVKRCEKPTRVTQADIDRSYIDRAKAELLDEQREREQKAKAAESAAVGRLATARNGHSPSPPAEPPLASGLIEAARNSEAIFAGVREEEATHRALDYAAACKAIGPRHGLEPSEGPFDPAVAAAWAASVPGWMTKEELRWLADRAAELVPGDQWIEIGTWRGRSLSAAFLAAPVGCYVVGVDHYRGSPEERQTTHADAAAALQGLRETMRELGKLRPGPSPVLRVCEAESVEAARMTEPGLAVVFIDAGHDYESVASDLESWSPKVRPGGLMAGHDRNEPGVAKALERWSRCWGVGINQGPGTLWWTRIPVEAETPEQPAEEGACSQSTP